MNWMSDDAMDHLRRVSGHDESDDSYGPRYDVQDEIARGGMGTVFRAYDRKLDRVVALKVLHEAQAGASAQARMMQEARILAQLEHPGIVPVHDVGALDDGRVFYAMKLVQGNRLDHYVRDRPSLRERLRIFERICEAVAFAHANDVIHRDLKPGNIMVGPFGEVLVMDWGVAKILGTDEAATMVLEPGSPPAAAGEPGSTHVGTVLGTPGYMAPEQAEGRVDLVDRRADVFALGKILGELIDEASTSPPRRLVALQRKASATRPEDRYSGVEQMVNDISRFLENESVSAYREQWHERAGRFVWRYRAPIALILAYLAVRALVLFFAGS